MPYFEFEGKRLYYEQRGEGRSVIFLHGNTASSKMFEFILPLYQQFQVITVDFLGYGLSERVAEFPLELWKWQARQIIALIQHLNVEKVCLVGTSGGAWAAVNAALERPDLIERVVADSFDGREQLDSSFADRLAAERQAVKENENAWWFYAWCQGQDWEEVVEKDTAALTACARQQLPLFSRPLSELTMPILLIGSRQDEMTEDLEQAYLKLKEKLPQAQLHLFEEGNHPSILTNAADSAQIIGEFLIGD